MSLNVDVSRTKLIYVIFELVLLCITIIYLTKHRLLFVIQLVLLLVPSQLLIFVSLVLYIVVV